MGKINQLHQDQKEERLAELESEIMVERGFHKRDDHDAIVELAWEALQRENGEIS